jgi:hypothetical protein
VVTGLCLLILSRVLPLHAAVLWGEDGRRSLSASRSDLVLGSGIAVLIVLLVWIVASVIMALVPARHVLVPHAAFWKSTKPRIHEMRRRYALYFARVIALTLFFVSAELVVAIAGQKGGPLALWWVPAFVSLVYIVLLLVFAVWIFTDGFAQPAKTATQAPQRKAPVSGRR